jgi:hypothetical protein
MVYPHRVEFLQRNGLNVIKPRRADATIAVRSLSIMSDFVHIHIMSSVVKRPSERILKLFGTACE